MQWKFSMCDAKNEAKLPQCWLNNSYVWNRVGGMKEEEGLVEI